MYQLVGALSPTSHLGLGASPLDNAPQTELNNLEIAQIMKFYMVVVSQPHYLPFSQILTVPVKAVYQLD